MKAIAVPTPIIVYKLHLLYGVNGGGGGGAKAVVVCL